ncbi:hypothetical protein NLB33_24200 [Mycolicibacterium smegmatis]|nr:hypothetical protein [Mycolicibacterium smegmatis]MCP2625947.1 hypothetical protein [Mycolicibacterium smegmatis]UGU31422.1 hypothetical protein LT350_00180 [Mycolicibacterium smegmatis]UUS11480.1 hypothetical protein NQ427_10555 [Mycolicibacterium smegmatis]UUS21306.1 hypothetical protein NQ425_10555 [Mycolicibacterium smegmatis]
MRTRVAEPLARALQRFAFLVHGRVVVEDDKSGGCVPGEHQVDRGVQVADARREQTWFGFGDDGLKLTDRRARLQRDSHRAEIHRRHVDDGVICTDKAPIHTPGRLGAHRRAWHGPAR